jgi:[ribosomal protein S5]-alanine N-acetyltransferase
MIKSFTTERLFLNELDLPDADFIFELLNMPEWKQFIGDRNIQNSSDAKAYIQKIMDNNDVCFWVVTLRSNRNPIGIVSFIKKDYLDYHDIGFAFLKDYTKKGYAFEATIAVLNDAFKYSNHTTILATTVHENENSIKFLKKLGFEYQKEILQSDVKLLLYSITKYSQKHI